MEKGKHKKGALKASVSLLCNIIITHWNGLRDGVIRIGNRAVHVAYYFV
jgi:hypothetical protein